MIDNIRFTIQYAIKNEYDIVEVFNDEYLNIEVEDAIEDIKKRNKGKKIDFWTVYYIDSKVFKSKDIQTGKITYREE